ncbi:MAG TPA: ATP-binding protein [Archangium sp.]|uniref:sensor histidine kinase n=1 Tax=Archangium sp. TaxID=1872627 RepID=UPI002EDB484B
MKPEQDWSYEEQRFSAIFNQGLVGIAHVDLTGRFIQVNPRFCEWVGRSHEELLHLRMQDITHPEDLGRNISLLERAVRGGQAFTIEKRYLRPDGSIIWVNNAVSVLINPEGKPHHFVAICQDISERKRTEAQLRFLSDASRVLSEWPEDVEQAVQAIARLAVSSVATTCVADLVQRDGSLRRVAAAHREPTMEPILRRLMKYPFATTSPIYPVLQTGQSLLHADITPEMDLRMAQDAEHLEALRAIGARSAMAVPLRARGRILGILLFSTSEPGRRYSPDDLTMAEELARRTVATLENARLFRESQEAVRLREEFLEVASHELRTPLMSLNLQLELLQRGLSEQSRQTGTGRLSAVRRQLTRLTLLVDSLLDVSRISAGRLELELSEVDLVELVRDALDRMHGVFAQTGSEVTLHAPSEPLVGRWDAARLDQVVMNLLGNAARYGQGRPIRLELRTDNAQVFLRVRDEGIGIAPEDRERIFGRFERAVSRRHYGGMGLGLYITRQIVEALGGEVWAESDLGRGSTFEVRLPLSPR